MKYFLSVWFTDVTVLKNLLWMTGTTDFKMVWEWRVQQQASNSKQWWKYGHSFCSCDIRLVCYDLVIEQAVNEISTSCKSVWSFSKRFVSTGCVCLSVCVCVWTREREREYMFYAFWQTTSWRSGRWLLLNFSNDQYKKHTYWRLLLEMELCFV